MKKFLAILMITALLVSGGPFSALAESEKEPQNFSPTLASAVDLEAEEWMVSENTRALISILLALDYQTAVGSDSDLAPDMGQPTYLGRDEGDLVLYVHATGRDILIMYRVSTGEASYMEADVMSDAIAETALMSACADGCHRNDEDAMLEVVTELQNIIGDS